MIIRIQNYRACGLFGKDTLLVNNLNFTSITIDLSISAMIFSGHKDRILSKYTQTNCSVYTYYKQVYYVRYITPISMAYPC